MVSSTLNLLSFKNDLHVINSLMGERIRKVERKEKYVLQIVNR